MPAARLLANAFIVLNLAAVSTWLAGWQVAPLQAYTAFVGLEQAWEMFAPKPGGFNSHLEAEVTLADGSHRIVTLPRMSEAGLLAKPFLERDRKWQESLQNPLYARALPDAARFVARQVPGARHVRLLVYWGMVLAPEWSLGKPLPAQRETRELISMDVAP